MIATELIVRDTSTVADGLAVSVEDASGAATVLIDADLGISFNQFVPGARFDFTGVLVPTAGGRSWVLKPRSARDVTGR